MGGLLSTSIGGTNGGSQLLFSGNSAASTFADVAAGTIRIGVMRRVMLLLQSVTAVDLSRRWRNKPLQRLRAPNGRRNADADGRAGTARHVNSEEPMIKPKRLDQRQHIRLKALLRLRVVRGERWDIF